MWHPVSQPKFQNLHCGRCSPYKIQKFWKTDFLIESTCIYRQNPGKGRGLIFAVLTRASPRQKMWGIDTSGYGKNAQGAAREYFRGFDAYNRVQNFRFFDARVTRVKKCCESILDQKGRTPRGPHANIFAVLTLIIAFKFLTNMFIKNQRGDPWNLKFFFLKNQMI